MLSASASTADDRGGYQLVLDNWKLEAYNEDHIYVQYNDVYYTSDIDRHGRPRRSVADSTAHTAFPPRIDRVRVANDVSFDLMEIADTQVYNGSDGQHVLPRPAGQPDLRLRELGLRLHRGRRSGPERGRPAPRARRRLLGWRAERAVRAGAPIARSSVRLGTRNFNPVNVLLGDTNIFNDRRTMVGEDLRPQPAERLLGGARPVGDRRDHG